MQKKTFYRLVFGFLFSILSGCASCGLKGQCEKVNWYQYGFELALKGQRIEQDNFILECRKADADIQESKLDTGFKAGMAQYCTVDGVYLTGKKGNPLNLEFCDPGQSALLKRRHMDGLREFCSPTAALSFGLGGNEYQNNCPQELENDFLPEFKKGRKRFLESEIQATSSELADLERKIDNKRYLVNQSNSALLILPSPSKKLVTKYDSSSKQNLQNYETVDPFSSQRERLQKQLESDREELKSLEARQNKLHSRKEYLRRELIKVSE